MRQKTTVDWRILWTIRACAIVLFGVFIWSLIANLLGLLSLDERLLAARKENKIVLQKNAELQDLVERHERGEFVEVYVREKLNMTKENEYIVLIPEEYYQMSQNRETPYSFDQNISDPVENWILWKELFFD